MSDVSFLEVQSMAFFVELLLVKKFRIPSQEGFVERALDINGTWKYSRVRDETTFSFVMVP